MVGNDGATFYVVTDKDAPRYRVVAIEKGRTDPAAWKTLIAQPANRDVLSSASLIANRFVTVWRVDAHEKLKLFVPRREARE